MRTITQQQDDGTPFRILYNGAHVSKHLRISVEARDTEHTALKVDESQRTIEAGTDDLLRRRITISV